MSIEAGIATPISPLEQPVIGYGSDGVVVANITPEALAQRYVNCCTACGVTALNAAREIVDFAPAPGRNMTVGKAHEVLGDRVGTHG